MYLTYYNYHLLVANAGVEFIVWLINQHLTKTQIFLNGKLTLLFSV